MDDSILDSAPVASEAEPEGTPSGRRYPIWPLVIWFVVVAGTLLARPAPVPAEARIFSAAWWEWQGVGVGADWTSGVAPLLVSLIHAGWALVGVVDWVPRLIVPAFGLMTLLVIVPVARDLWPGQPRVARLAPVILIGFAPFAGFAGLAVTPTAMMAAVLLGLAGGVRLWRGARVVGGLLLALGLALGLAVVGPLAILPVAAALLTAPRWWRGSLPLGSWRAWYGVVGAGLAAGVAASLPWLWSRFAGSTAVGALWGADAGSGLAWYFWLLLAPVVFYPWPWWRTARHAVLRQAGRLMDEDAFRLGLAAAVAAAAGFLVGGHWAVEDLLPLLAPLSLCLARLLVAEDSPARDFHAVGAALPILLAGVVFFLLNIVPVAHLDDLWRGLSGSEERLPVWLGGVGLAAGMLIMGGGFLLAQLVPRGLHSRAVQVALLSTLLATALNLEMVRGLRPFFDLAPLADQLRALQQSGRPVAVFGPYAGEFDFAGRLSAPPAVLADPAAALAWASEHADGVVLTRLQGGLLHLPAKPLYLGAAGQDWAALWSAQTVTATAGAVLRRQF